MLRQLLQIAVILLVSVVTQWSCRTERDVVIGPQRTEITIEEAKAWAIKSASETNARAGTDDKIQTRNEYWNDAINDKSSTGQSLVIVPMTYRYERAVGFWGSQPKTLKSADKADYFVQSKLVVYKDARNVIQSYVIRVVPTEENRAKYKRVKGDAFDGMMLVFSRDETQYYGGWTYKNGKATGWFNQLGSKNGRLAGICYYRQYIPLGDNPPAMVGGGGTPQREYVTSGGQTYEVVTIEAPCGDTTGGGSPPGDTGGGENPSPPGGGGGGSPGSGGGGDNGNLDSSPLYNFIYDMANNRNVYFSNEEREFLHENPGYIEIIRNYVNQYGQKPDGSRAFILSDPVQQQYPRFTELVKSLPDFVEQHDRVKQALIQHTHLPWNDIKSKLKFGQGPKVVVNELSPASYYGHTVYPAFPEPFIEISARYVRGLEAANLNGTREATAFLLTVTMLHELTHYGAVDGGRNETRNNEFGDDFERTVLGTTIGRDNAGKLLIDFNKAN